MKDFTALLYRSLGLLATFSVKNAHENARAEIRYGAFVHSLLKMIKTALLSMSNFAIFSIAIESPFMYNYGVTVSQWGDTRKNPFMITGGKNEENYCYALSRSLCLRCAGCLRRH
ncbi:hypothetical protein [Ruminococcus sp.]|uniref:hypothetical protein n=1 Tax=Ruminococcus sp. TaxID=41978 RepID=UPI00386B9388